MGFATSVEDIHWPNFQSPDWLFWKRVGVNLALFAFTWGVTTPEHIADALAYLFPTRRNSETSRIYALVLILNLASKSCSWLMNVGIEFLGTYTTRCIFRDTTESFGVWTHAEPCSYQWYPVTTEFKHKFWSQKLSHLPMVL